VSAMDVGLRTALFAIAAVGALVLAFIAVVYLTTGERRARRRRSDAAR
jgi:hypothetical protein